MGEMLLSGEGTIRAWVRSNEYRDSMVLMFVSAQLRSLPGIKRGMAIMATDANKELLAGLGLATPEVGGAGPNDLAVVVEADHPDAAQEVADQLDSLLARRMRSDDGPDARFRSIEGAASALPGANLAVISIPGRYAAREARRALDLGLHAFLFSDNVSLADEVELKLLGRRRGLLVMGPDCGTAIIGGVALGFANVVRRGNIGVVGAAGTGIQEITVLIDRAGGGISHAIGTGGRDLAGEVGAITTLQALAGLQADPRTEAIVVVSKLPSPEVAARVIDRARGGGKPVVACFLGYQDPTPAGDRVAVVGTLEEAAARALELVGQSRTLSSEAQRIDPARAARASPAPRQRYLRGLYSGGSLCEEAMVVWRDIIGPVWSNVALSPDHRLADPLQSRGHTAIDLGDDYFTGGRPHPMIDAAIRRERLLREAADPAVAVVVLDVVLGHGAHPNMAGELAPAIAEARLTAEREGRHLAVVAYVCGTEADPQVHSKQSRQLAEAGALLAPSNAAAARMAGLIIAER